MGPEAVAYCIALFAFLLVAALCGIALELIERLTGYKFFEEDQDDDEN